MDSESRVKSSRYLLASDNYSTWTVSIEARLKDIGACEVVTGLLKMNKKTTAEEIAAYSVLNWKGYSKVVQNLDAANLALVSTTPWLLVRCLSTSDIKGALGVARL
ncbi:hypothetical protein PCANC_05138 [Puccinia coronata f. sp. avenae]|uniref:DUF4219 domain-containing protein n=1 Tax=Puccinia coronata f. sp. avenae TaxID=200324 RepID=A0A2N5W308_9BASI|nr:hypothetical protein PCANC_05138 [Puccinia coronata f. sp. avenae]